MNWTRPRLTPLLVAAAAFVAAGGYVHLREWAETYRDVPAGTPGAAVVRIGFPVNGVVSILVAIGLVMLATGVAKRRVVPLVALAVGFQVASLAALITTRVGSLAGWSEPVWTRGANQTRAVEIGALVCLAAVLAMRASVVRPRVAV